MKLDHLNLTLYGGYFKFASKIDLITNKQTNILNKINEKSYFSTFDFYYLNDFYLLGTYSKNIYLIDKQNDKVIEKIKNSFHVSGISNLKFINKGLYFLSQAKKDNHILLWDTRKLNTYLNIYERNTVQTNQKTNFALDNEERYLFLGNKVNNL